MAIRLSGTRQARLLAGAAALIAMAAPSPLMAQTRSFNVPAQAAGRGIPMFARQAGIQLLASANTVRGRRTNAVRGSLTVAEGLRQLLAGTGLEAVPDTGGTGIVTIRATLAAATGEAGAGGAAADSGDAEIVVTGSRLPSEGAAPVTTFDARRIAETGVNQVADVLRYLPQQSFHDSEGTTFGASRAVQLRGLGLGTTLVLVNGRRTITSALQNTRNSFDINMLPLSAVERIEVLTESASSVYGADAIGGVMNVILKDEIERPTAEFYHGFADGGAEEYQASVALSLPIEGLRNIFVFDYFERDPLFGRERAVTRDSDFTRFGGTDQRVPNANPGNICSVDGANLPGLSAPCAAVPAGSSGIGLTPADFVATAGQTNLQSLYADTTLLPAGERYSVVAQLRYDLSPAVAAFGELLYVNREDRNIFPASPVSFGFVPATNPFNPFGVPVFVDYRFDTDTVGPVVSRFNSEAWRLVGGVNGRFQGGEWEAAVLYTRDKGRNVDENEFDPAAVSAALAETDPALALNVFQDGPGGSEALLASLRVTDPAVDRLQSEALQGSAFVRSELFSLAGGPVEAVVGAEVRNEAIVVDSEMFGISLDADRDTVSGFFEVRAPLISPEQGSPLGHRLVVTASGRYDRYSDFGGTFNPRVAIVWEPTRSLLLRGAYGTSFRAPSLFELYLPATIIPGLPVPDPRRGNEVSIVSLSLSGNPDLDPEEARSLTAGIVFAPDGASGLRLGATYWSIEQDQRVVRTNPFQVLANESFFPDLIERAAPTPADVAAGRPGRLLAINAPNINSGRAETSGIDFEASLGIDSDFGRFAPSLRVTWVHSYKAADYPFSPVTDRVGLAQVTGTIPDVTAVATIAWSHDGIGASLTGRYISSYDDVDSFGVANGRDVSPPLLVDLQLSADLGRIASSRLLDGLVLRAGAINLFDDGPSFTEVNGAYGYDTSQFDIRGRFLYFRISKAF